MKFMAIIALLFASAGLGDATPASSLRGGANGSPTIEEDSVVELFGDCPRFIMACCGPKGDRSDCQPTRYTSGREAKAAGGCRAICETPGCSLEWGDPVGDCYEGTIECFPPTNILNSGISIQEACARQTFNPEVRNAYECEGGEYPFACCKGPAEIDFPDAGDKFGTCRVIPNGQDELAVE